VQNFQREGGCGKFELDIWRRTAWGGAVRFSTELPRTALPNPSHPSLVLEVLRVNSLGRFWLDLVLLLIVKEVTARAVRAVASYPVLLASLGLVLVVLPNITHLVISMSKLAQLSIQTLTLLFKVPADFCFKPGVGTRGTIWV